MDFGSGTYPSSLGWILPRYEAMGVRFDEVWAWEAAPVKHPKYWAEVPAWLLPRLHVSGRHAWEGGGAAAQG